MWQISFIYIYIYIYIYYMWQISFYKSTLIFVNLCELHKFNKKYIKYKELIKY
jgi:hypothetical protein